MTTSHLEHKPLAYELYLQYARLAITLMARTAASKHAKSIIERVESVVDRYSRGAILEPYQRSKFEVSLSQLNELERGLQYEKPSLWSAWETRQRERGE